MIESPRPSSLLDRVSNGLVVIGTRYCILLTMAGGGGSWEQDRLF